MILISRRFFCALLGGEGGRGYRDTTAVVGFLGGWLFFQAVCVRVLFFRKD